MKKLKEVFIKGMLIKMSYNIFEYKLIPNAFK